jgi:hypothetical protein
MLTSLYLSGMVTGLVLILIGMSSDTAVAEEGTVETPSQKKTLFITGICVLVAGILALIITAVLS